MPSLPDAQTRLRLCLQWLATACRLLRTRLMLATQVRQARAAGLIHEGKSQEEVGKVMMAEFNWAAGSLQMQWSLPGIMKELK